MVLVMLRVVIDGGISISFITVVERMKAVSATC